MKTHLHLAALTIAAFTTSITHAQQAASYSAAYRTAELTNRPLIVALGADWCGPCREMESLYAAQLRARGCYVHLNVDRDRALCRQLPAVPSIPALVIYERQQGIWLRPRIIIGLPAIRIWLGK